MSDGEALLAAIRLQPDDDLPRLAYADWLDENHDPDRAQFVRLQIESERHLAGSPRHTQLTDEALELFQKHGPRWIAGYEKSLPAQAELTARKPKWDRERGLLLWSIQFHRGFVEAVSVRIEDFFSLDESAIQPEGPLPTIRLQVHNRGGHPYGAMEYYLDDLAASPLLSKCRHVSIDGGFSATTDQGLYRLARKPELLAKLSGLNLSEDRISDQGLLAVLESPHLAGLRELSIDATDCTEVVPAFLARSERFRGLTMILFDGCFRGGQGIRQFARPGQWPRLRHLWLISCGIDSLTWKGLARPGAFPALEVVNLSCNDLHPPTIRALVASGAFPRLRWLGLGGTPMSLDELRALRDELAGRVEIAFPVPRDRREPTQTSE